jgi:hypothetical protein
MTETGTGSGTRRLMKIELILDELFCSNVHVMSTGIIPFFDKRINFSLAIFDLIGRELI